MSVICADLIVCKMAKRDLHPFIVIFAMISTVSALSIPAIAAYAPWAALLPTLPWARPCTLYAYSGLDM